MVYTLFLLILDKKDAQCSCIQILKTEGWQVKLANKVFKRFSTPFPLRKSMQLKKVPKLLGTKSYPVSRTLSHAVSCLASVYEFLKKALTKARGLRAHREAMYSPCNVIMGHSLRSSGYAAASNQDT